MASRRTADPEAPARALEAWVQRLTEEFEIEARPAAVLLAFGGACLELLAAECGALDPGIPADPHFISCLLIESP